MEAEWREERDGLQEKLNKHKRMGSPGQVYNSHQWWLWRERWKEKERDQ